MRHDSTAKREPDPAPNSSLGLQSGVKNVLKMKKENRPCEGAAAAPEKSRYGGYTIDAASITAMSGGPSSKFQNKIYMNSKIDSVLRQEFYPTQSPQVSKPSLVNESLSDQASMQLYGLADQGRRLVGSRLMNRGADIKFSDANFRGTTG